jgi:hypothetical protein
MNTFNDFPTAKECRDNYKICPTSDESVIYFYNNHLEDLKKRIELARDDNDHFLYYHNKLTLVIENAEAFKRFIDNFRKEISSFLESKGFIVNMKYNEEHLESVRWFFTNYPDKHCNSVLPYFIRIDW